MIVRVLSAVTFFCSFLVFASPARAAVDIDGPWFVRMSFDVGGPPGADVNNDCHWTSCRRGRA